MQIKKNITKGKTLPQITVCRQSDLGDEPRGGANRLDSLPSEQNSSSGERKCSWGLCQSWLLCSFQRFRQAKLPSRVCADCDSHWLTVRRCIWRQRFPWGAPRLSNCCFSCQKKTHFSSSKAVSCSSPALGNQTQLFLTTHTSTNKIVSTLAMLFFSSSFFWLPESSDFQHKSRSTVMFGRMSCFYFYFLTHKWNFEAGSLCCLLCRTGWPTSGNCRGGKHCG